VKSRFLNSTSCFHRSQRQGNVHTRNVRLNAIRFCWVLASIHLGMLPTVMSFMILTAEDGRCFDAREHEPILGYGCCVSWFRRVLHSESLGG
jgi:hypothetical protein